jgi:penicillin-binding protein 2
VITQGQKRFYTNGIKTAHLTGYIGSPTESDLAKFPSLNYNDFVIGKNGVEKVLDEALRGYPGVKKIEVDALGTQIRELSNTPPIPGKTLKLSIDLELQDYISEVLGTNAGTVVVLNIKTGELLALYSSPSYDPNLFIGGISTQDWEALVSNPNTPLINKAISSAYPPGSTFKLVTAAAALEYGIPADYKVFCNGQHKVGNRIFHCNRKSGHGYVDIKFAIAQSCNVYFYTVAEKIGMKNLAKAAHALGLGSKTDIELPYEAKGNIPEPTWKILKFRQNWTLGDTVNASIGQGFILTTPIQLAVMAANIASGKQVKPTILYQETPQNFQDLSFDARHISTLKLGMFMVFNHHQGNGYKGRINDPSFQLCGKTGTAQVISSRVAKKKHHVDHGLFMGFAPYHDPTYAISVIIEHGSWGAGSALPIAKMILNKAHLMNP